MDRRKAADGAASQPIEVELIAVLAAVAEGSPLVMTIDGGRALPSGPFEVEHRSLQSGLRAWVERQTGHPLGYLEQLYTFADSDRRTPTNGARAISISYLALMREEPSRLRGRPGAPGTITSRGRTIAQAPLLRSRRRSRLNSRIGRREAAMRLCATAVQRSPLASGGDSGMRNSSCSGTSCSTKQASSPKPAARSVTARGLRSERR